MMNYNKTIADCFFHPRHVGGLDVSISGVVFFSNATFSQGVLIDLYLHSDGNHTVLDMRFKTNGNPYVIAALEWLCRQSVGKKLELLSFNREEYINLLALPFNQVPLVMQIEDVYKEIVSLIIN
jgi:nitrogen fixation NifU-like protein